MYSILSPPILSIGLIDKNFLFVVGVYEEEFCVSRGFCPNLKDIVNTEKFVWTS